MEIKQAINRIAEGQDLSLDEMQSVMGQVMRGEAGDAQIGAFLMGLRMKGETLDEITGAVMVMRELASGVLELHHNCLCQYGTSWKKPTTVMVWGTTTQPRFRCCTGLGGLCSRTGLPHESLSCAHDISKCTHNKGFRTRMAQDYPKAFARYLFSLFQ